MDRSIKMERSIVERGQDFKKSLPECFKKINGYDTAEEFYIKGMKDMACIYRNCGDKKRFDSWIETQLS
jgi:hypothetical protein